MRKRAVFIVLRRRAPMKKNSGEVIRIKELDVAVGHAEVGEAPVPPRQRIGKPPVGQHEKGKESYFTKRRERLDNKDFALRALHARQRDAYSVRRPEQP